MVGSAVRRAWGANSSRLALTRPIGSRLRATPASEPRLRRAARPKAARANPLRSAQLAKSPATPVARRREPIGAQTDSDRISRRPEPVS